MKKIIATALVAVMAVMALCLTACGELDINKIKGDWTASAINDTAIADYAASLGVDTTMAAVNMTVADDGKTVAISNALVAQTYDITLKSNGFEILNPDKTIYCSVEFKDDTLNYSVSDGTNTYKYTLVKGTTDFTATTAAETEADVEEVPAEDVAADETVAEDEAADEAADETVAEDAADDEAADDEAADETVADDAADEEVVDDAAETEAAAE